MVRQASRRRPKGARKAWCQVASCRHTQVLPRWRWPGRLNRFNRSRKRGVRSPWNGGEVQPPCAASLPPARTPRWIRVCRSDLHVIFSSPGLKRNSPPCERLDQSRPQSRNSQWAAGRRHAPVSARQGVHRTSSHELDREPNPTLLRAIRLSGGVTAPSVSTSSGRRASGVEALDKASMFTSFGFTLAASRTGTGCSQARG